MEEFIILKSLLSFLPHLQCWIVVLGQRSTRSTRAVSAKSILSKTLPVWDISVVLLSEPGLHIMKSIVSIFYFIIQSVRYWALEISHSISAIITINHSILFSGLAKQEKKSKYIDYKRHNRSYLQNKIINLEYQLRNYWKELRFWWKDNTLKYKNHPASCLKKKKKIKKK